MKIQRQADTFALVATWGDSRPPPPKKAQPPQPMNVVEDNGSRIMRDSETGLGYDVIARPNPKGDGWDVVKIL